MARPAKPANLISLEGKSHRTKRELAYRKEAEKQTLSGLSLRESPEVKNDELAHKTYLSVKKSLKAIGKDDALYSAVVNRYCMITSEVLKLEADRARVEEMIKDTENARGEFEHYRDYLSEIKDLMKLKTGIDRELKAKRQQLFSIEKENCMTIASALRSIPKKPETKTNALKEALSG